MPTKPEQELHASLVAAVARAHAIVETNPRDRNVLEMHAIQIQLLAAILGRLLNFRP